jgi:hypothetical protein
MSTKAYEKHTPVKSKYPCILKNKNTGYLVYMYKECQGVVIGLGTSDYKDGHHTVHWKMENFREYLGALVVENA